MYTNFIVFHNISQTSGESNGCSPNFADISVNTFFSSTISRIFSRIVATPNWLSEVSEICQNDQETSNHLSEFAKSDGRKGTGWLVAWQMIPLPVESQMLQRPRPRFLSEYEVSYYSQPCREAEPRQHPGLRRVFCARRGICDRRWRGVGIFRFGAIFCKFLSVHITFW